MLQIMPGSRRWRLLPDQHPMAKRLPVRRNPAKAMRGNPNRKPQPTQVPQGQSRKIEQDKTGGGPLRHFSKRAILIRCGRRQRRDILKAREITSMAFFVRG